MQKYQRIAKKIYQLLPQYEDMTDEQLQQQTAILRTKLETGNHLASLLPEAFAVVIEADKRVLGLTPYYVQVLGGIALFLGILPKLRQAKEKHWWPLCRFIQEHCLDIKGIT